VDFLKVREQLLREDERWFRVCFGRTVSAQVMREDLKIPYPSRVILMEIRNLVRFRG